MILDGLLQFSSAQAITAAAASTNYIDVGEARNIGEGKDLYVLTVVTTTLTDGGSNTGTEVHLYGDSTSTFTPDGDQLMFKVPQAAAAGSGPYYGKISPSFVAGVLSGNYQFLEIFYTPTGANLTGGAFSTYITTDIAGFIAYKRGYTIS